MNKKVIDALLAFVDTIEATGGVMPDPKGYIVPVADTDWADLGNAYELACKAVGRKMKMVPFEKD